MANGAVAPLAPTGVTTLDSGVAVRPVHPAAARSASAVSTANTGDAKAAAHSAAAQVTGSSGQSRSETGGERKRGSAGWDSLTPAEGDVVRLVCEGLADKDIATRLFISPRTVQAHLTHIYTKPGLTSRVHLVQEAARHA